jgi:hypothetical protein
VQRDLDALVSRSSCEVSRHMAVLEASYPSDVLLVTELSEMLSLAPSDVRIVKRRRLGSGTYPKEEVVLSTATGSLDFFCKYAAPRDAAFGHRGGVAYECAVYQEILAPLSMTAPPFVGCRDDEQDSWLVLGYLEGNERVKHRAEHVVSAAEWLGRFHKRAESRSLNPSAEFLIRYDTCFLEGWADRATDYARRVGRDHGFVRAIGERFTTLVPVMLEAPATVIHGEFTVSNVLAVQGVIYPTDWESAAVGAGEIDLMCLLDGWDDDTRMQAIESYASARWNHTPPANFLLRVLAADFYNHLRWIGDALAPQRLDRSAWRFDKLDELLALCGDAVLEDLQ